MSMMEEDVNIASLSETHLRGKRVKHAKKLTIKEPKANRMKDPLASEKCLDLVIILEKNFELKKFAEVIEKHYKHIIKSIKRDTKSLRVSLAKYWDLPQKEDQMECADQMECVDQMECADQMECVDQLECVDQMKCVDIHDFASTDEGIKEMFESMKDSGTKDEDPKGSRLTVPGKTRGLANALFKVSHLTFRKKANKVCILLASSTHRIANNGDRPQDPHPFTNPDHDIVVLTRLLASRGLSLHVIGCLPNHVKIKYEYKEALPDPGTSSVGRKKRPKIDCATEFFEPKHLGDDSHYLQALAHISGGRYIPIFSTSYLAKVVVHLIKEDNTLEDLMGFANDEVTLEVSRQFGDANAFHLSKTLRQRSILKKIKLLKLNRRVIPPICELAERLSWAPDFLEMQEIFNSTKTSCRHDPMPHPILHIGNVECLYEEYEQRDSEDYAMRMVRRLFSRLA